jgi:hypothetical protein
MDTFNFTSKVDCWIGLGINLSSFFNTRHANYLKEMSLNIVLRVGGTSSLIKATSPNVTCGRSQSMAKGQRLLQPNECGPFW